jgi:hypothetical protein
VSLMEVSSHTPPQRGTLKARFLHSLSLSPDTERRPVAEQIADQILAADPARYKVYAALRSDATVASVAIFPGYTDHRQAHAERSHAALGFFLAQWIAFERFLRGLAEFRGADPRGPAIPSPGILRRFEVFSPSELAEVEHIRRVRNNLVHGVEVPDAEYLEDIGKSLGALLAKLAHDERPDVQLAAQRALRDLNIEIE